MYRYQISMKFNSISLDWLSCREDGPSTTFYNEVGLISNWAFQKLIDPAIVCGGYRITGLACTIRALLSYIMEARQAHFWIVNWTYKFSIATLDFEMLVKWIKQFSTPTFAMLELLFQFSFLLQFFMLVIVIFI
jgi:hypothetical protein